MSKGEFVKNPNYAEYLRPSPGPAKYKLPSLIGCTGHDPRKIRQPCYTIGYRPGMTATHVGPGPAEYQLGKMNRFGIASVPAYMGFKLRDGKLDVTPSPNAYELPELIGGNRTKNYMHRAPDFIMGGKLGEKISDATPGPAAYVLRDGGKATKPRAPAYSMASRAKWNRGESKPGPAEYMPVYADKHKILVSLGGRNDINYNNGIPGPNKYDLKHYKPGREMPGYSMGIRYPDWLAPAITKADN